MYVDIYTHRYRYVCVYIYIHIYIHTHMYMYMYTDINIHVYMDPCTYQHLELHLKPPLINVLVIDQLHMYIH